MHDAFDRRSGVDGGGDTQQRLDGGQVTEDGIPFFSQQVGDGLLPPDPVADIPVIKIFPTKRAYAFSTVPPDGRYPGRYPCEAPPEVQGQAGASFRRRSGAHMPTSTETAPGARSPICTAR
ncbi:hypothetical protein ACFWA5_41880 [Streptomyces mirabilis]|uniref:hypothetical protein n=1 Tax=Streptomyces mirabilis TaxID=68239 RepID=UPI003665F6CF